MKYIKRWAEVQPKSIKLDLSVLVEKLEFKNLDKTALIAIAISLTIITILFTIQAHRVDKAIRQHYAPLFQSIPHASQTDLHKLTPRIGTGEMIQNTIKQ